MPQTVLLDSEMPADTGQASADGGTSLSFSFVNTTGTYLLVAVVLGDSDVTDAITDVTYNGVSLGAALVSRRVINNTRGRVALYGLANPATGSNTLAVTSSGNSGAIIAGALSFRNVSLTTPIGQVWATDDAGVNTAIPTLTVTATSYVVTVAGGGTDFTGNPIGGTRSWLKNVSASWNVDNAVCAYALGTGVPLTISETLVGSDSWAMVAVSLNPAALPAPYAYLVPTQRMV